MGELCAAPGFMVLHIIHPCSNVFPMWKETDTVKVQKGFEVHMGTEAGGGG